MSTLVELFTAKTTEAFPYELLLYGHYKYENDWQSILHSHPHTEIFYVLGGKGAFLTSNSRLEMKKGMLLINNPGVLHTEISNPDDPLEYAIFAIKNMSFTADAPTDFPELFSADPEHNLESTVFDLSAYRHQIADVVKSLDAEINKKEEFWESACITEFNKLLILIMRRLKLISAPIRYTGKQNVADFVKEYFNHHYSDDIDLDSLAQTFFVNKYYLAHAFKKKFGVSPMYYLNKLRCEKAHDLLLSSNQTVATISSSVGFASASYFSSIYRKYYSETPQKTRKQAQ